MSANTKDPVKEAQPKKSAAPPSTGTEKENMPSPYTPIDQSVFEHQTGEAEGRIDARRKEKEALAAQQRTVTLVAGIVVALVVVGVVAAIIISTVT